MGTAPLLVNSQAPPAPSFPPPPARPSPPVAVDEKNSNVACCHSVPQHTPLFELAEPGLHRVVIGIVKTMSPMKTSPGKLQHLEGYPTDCLCPKRILQHSPTQWSSIPLLRKVHHQDCQCLTGTNNILPLRPSSPLLSLIDPRDLTSVLVGFITLSHSCMKLFDSHLRMYRANQGADHLSNVNVRALPVGDSFTAGMRNYEGGSFQPDGTGTISSQSW
ncbi:hypothetical protein DL96DRAFT_1720688 [Flagelloscypha sp. PMI_526]|nr:hypothetical protein DL96DRAFT_1720688 [Flagelloscypha sp. PMI_526]